MVKELFVLHYKAKQIFIKAVLYTYKKAHPLFWMGPCCRPDYFGTIAIGMRASAYNSPVSGCFQKHRISEPLIVAPMRRPVTTATRALFPAVVLCREEFFIGGAMPTPYAYRSVNQKCVPFTVWVAHSGMSSCTI